MEAAAAATMPVKFTLFGSKRRLRLNMPLKFEHLREKVYILFQIKEFQLEYVDEEADHIIVGSDPELQEAQRVFKDLGRVPSFVVKTVVPSKSVPHTAREPQPKRLLGPPTQALRRRVKLQLWTRNGVDLNVALDQQPMTTDGVPIIVDSCLKYLNKNATNCESLFRVPGNDANVCKIWDYMEDRPLVRLSENCVEECMRKHPEFSAHDVASFLKRFISQIAGDEPVVTYICYRPLVNQMRSPCPSEYLGEKLWSIVDQLLVPSRCRLLQRLCTFLLDFSKHEAITHMGCEQLAFCFGYCMQPPPEVENKCKRELSATEISGLAKTVGEKQKCCVSVLRALMEHDLVA